MSSHHNGNSERPGTLLDCNAHANLWPYIRTFDSKRSTLKSFFPKTDSRCRKGCSRDHKKPEPSTSSSTSSQRNPLQSSSEATAVFALCIHGRFGLEEPLDHWIAVVEGCKVQRCAASEPRPEAKPQAEPIGTKGTKFGENFGASSRSFENWGHSKSSLDLS